MIKKTSLGAKNTVGKKKYFINGFKHLYDAFIRGDRTHEYTFLFPKNTRHDFATNYLLLKKWIKEGKLEGFDVLHFNCWENVLQFDNKKHKKPGQVSIAEAHGYYLGVNFMATIREQPLGTRIPNYILKLFFDSKMQRRIREYDLFYYSTPNMKLHAEKIRKDAKWLPNPVDTSIFTDKGPKVKLAGNPSVFLPTRLHAFKNPLFGIEIFNEIKKKHPSAKLHMIRYGVGADPLFSAFKKMVDEKDVVFHDRMPRQELAKYYRSADLVLGQFNPGLANFSMVEIEAMACKAPLVTLDFFELKAEYSKLENLAPLALRLISDAKFRNSFVKRNFDYVQKTHSEKAVCKINLENIRKVSK